jgi:nicotinamidase-related amidase
MDWRNQLPPGERERLLSLGLGSTAGSGHRPALIVVDVVDAFLGERPDGAVSESHPIACGPVGWQTLPAIAGLLEQARHAGIPRILTKGSWPEAGSVGGAIKFTQSTEIAQRVHLSGFPTELAPREEEFVLEKTKPSAFFGTSLQTYLTRNGVDTLIVCGTTTSGCVRATVVDGFSMGYRIQVPHDACFDRSAFSHASNLFDMELKYADVLESSTVIERLASL